MAEPTHGTRVPYRASPEYPQPWHGSRSTLPPRLPPPVGPRRTVRSASGSEQPGIARGESLVGDDLQSSLRFPDQREVRCHEVSAGHDQPMDLPVVIRALELELCRDPDKVRPQES